MQVSPASSSPTLTKLGREGKTNGVFFRTITSMRCRQSRAGKFAVDQGLKKIAIIHVNNDFGVNMVKRVRQGLQGARRRDHLRRRPATGQCWRATQSGDRRCSACRTRSICVPTPVDGATIARAWISQGGPQKFLLNDGMNSEEFITSRRGISGTTPSAPSGTDATASTDYFNKEYKAFSGLDPASPRRRPAL